MSWHRNAHPVEVTFHEKGYDINFTLTDNAVTIAHNTRCMGDHPLLHQSRAPMSVMMGDWVIKSTTKETRKAVVINRHNGDYVEFEAQVPLYRDQNLFVTRVALGDAIKSLAVLAMFGREEA